MLRLFVSKGAGSTDETRWVLSEVLAAAILQDDVQTISFLVCDIVFFFLYDHFHFFFCCFVTHEKNIVKKKIGTYPDLMYRESSGMWSLPLHQASRLNKFSLVQQLLQLGTFFFFFCLF
jgi:hypothetical protein